MLNTTTRLSSFFHIDVENNKASFNQDVNMMLPSNTLKSRMVLSGNDMYKVNECYAAGYNEFKQTGTESDEIKVSSFTSLGTSKWKEIYSAEKNTFFMDFNNKIHAVGSNEYGQLGNGTITNEPNTTITRIGNSKWNGIYFSSQTSKIGFTVYALDENNYLYSWGENTYGQIGDGTTTHQSAPYQVSTTPFKKIVPVTYEISSERFTSCYALDENNYLYTWGYNGFGQLGLGHTNLVLTPTKVGTTKWRAICTPYADGKNVILLDANNIAYSMGSNLYGRNGNGLTSGNQTLPYKISDTAFIALYIYENFVIAFDKKTGYAYTWGNNQNGQLGLGTTEDKLIPTKVSNTKWTALLQNRSNSVFVLDEDNVLYSWGKNTYGQIGNGTTLDQLTPYKVSNTKWKRFAPVVDVENYTMFMLDENNSLYTWGYNTNGQCGIGTTQNQTLPIKVSNIKFNDIQVFGGSVYGLADTYELYTWGKNGYGQLGLGTYTNQLTPFKISNTKWMKISGSYRNAFIFSK